MKKLEIGLIGLLIIALLMKIYRMPSAGVLLTATALTLAFIYALWGVSNFKEVDIKTLIAGGLRVTINSKDQLIGFIAGMGLSVGIMSILFKVQHWPSANVMMTAAGLSLALVSVLTGVLYMNKKETKYLNIFRRSVAVLCMLAVLWLSKTAII